MDCLSLPTPPDHPRIRGEHHGYFAFRVMMVGSSPHTRGALADGQARRVQAGIIPAYAGSTPTLRPRGGRRGDHPRIRGEHVDKQLARPFFDGSSPHTRGAPRVGCRRTAGRRIIPAYAGSTSVDSGPFQDVRDHPRIRGEHGRSQGAGGDFEGSSPHTRGARVSGRTCTRSGRIIPAYAGSTSSNTALCHRARDHPRIRGEHDTLEKYARSVPGSSPHTRGAPVGKNAIPISVGIIPAYAGSTSHVRGGFGRPADHPRIRGEHSPQAVSPGGSCGIIPAYAGSTSSISASGS